MARGNTNTLVCDLRLRGKGSGVGFFFTHAPEGLGCNICLIRRLACGAAALSPLNRTAELFSQPPRLASNFSALKDSFVPVLCFSLLLQLGRSGCDERVGGELIPRGPLNRFDFRTTRIYLSGMLFSPTAIDSFITRSRICLFICFSAFIDGLSNYLSTRV